MSWLALTTARISAITPIAVSWPVALPGFSKLSAPITATSSSWSTRRPPRRRSGQRIGQRSIAGAQNIFRV
jgi:hypothetical protein